MTGRGDGSEPAEWPVNRQKRRDEDRRAVAAKFPEWVITWATSGRMVATRRDDPEVTVDAEDGTDMTDILIGWQWRHGEQPPP